MFVPAHRSFSMDVLRNPALEVATAPAWTINIFKLQLGIVYFFAGLAKLNPDWLFDAMPLRIWLPANAHLPVIGWLLELPPEDATKLTGTLIQQGELELVRPNMWKTAEPVVGDWIRRNPEKAQDLFAANPRCRPKRGGSTR